MLYQGIKIHKIKRDTLEWLIIYSILVFSFINSISLLVSLMMLAIFLLKQKAIGAIKLLNILTLRTIINPGIAVSINQIEMFKWLIIFLCSFYLISMYNKMNKAKKSIIIKIAIPFSIFILFSVISSFFFSTLPTIAIFKIISYSIPFLGVLVGIIATNEKFDWIEWLYKMFMIITLASVPLIFSSLGYLANGYAFQGITNQPNMLGIFLALHIGLILTNIQKNFNQNNIYKYILIILIFAMIILSESRTGFISSVILVALFSIFSKHNKFKKLLISNIITVILIIYLAIDNSPFSLIQEFLLKGQDDILYSRAGQVNRLMNNFSRSPWFGSGFAVPVTPQRSYAFSTEYVVEPGNLVLAVLSYVGIIGFVLFIIFIASLLLINKKNFKILGYLPLAVILISMGEMLFFSTNNIGIWLYMFLAIYVSDY